MASPERAAVTRQRGASRAAEARAGQAGGTGASSCGGRRPAPRGGGAPQAEAKRPGVGPLSLGLLTDPRGGSSRRPRWGTPPNRATQKWKMRVCEWAEAYHTINGKYG